MSQMLIPYAGAEKIRFKPNSKEERRHRAYQKFRSGMSTHKIARDMGVTEAKAEKYVTLGRCKAKGLRDPYA